MRLRWTKPILGVLACLLVSSVLAAGDIPLVDWEVRHQGVVIHSPDGLGKAGLDISNGVAFVATTPCRIVDTRPSQGFPPAWGPPILAANATRDFDLNSAPHCATIPAGVEAYSLNFTIAEPAGPGDLRAYPQGNPPATPTSVMNWTGSGAAFAIANAAIIPAGTSGGITVQVAGNNAHLIVDINGYFTDEFNGSNYFSVVSSCDTCIGVIFGSNTSTAVAGTGGNFIGNSDQQMGGGVRATAASATAEVFGVYGLTNSSHGNTAGVLGQAGSFFTGSGVGPIGVLGHSDVATGVLGEGLTRGVNGCRETFASGVGTPVACGVLGFSGNSGVHAFQDVTAGGAKPFVVPYEGDPTKQIVYIATEADEALTSTRGRVKIERGVATIRVPGHFLKVTEPEGWSVQLTPIGDMATFAVLRIDPQAGAVLIKGSRNVEVFYRIEGVRRGYADFQPVQENIYFVPESGKAKMDPWPESTKQILISNGIYNPDGTPNLETAERLGWKRIWDEKEKAAAPRVKPGNNLNR